MLPFINPTPVLITALTIFGVFFHDTHVDKAAALAVAAPAAIVAAAVITSTTSPSEVLAKANEHIHVERPLVTQHITSLEGTSPKTQPPRDDDKKHLQQKRISYSGGNSQNSLWPSV